jgi:hypothetical protein
VRRLSGRLLGVALVLLVDAVALLLVLLALGGAAEVFHV